MGIINAIPSIKRVLVICPASLRLNWAAEARKWLVREFSIGIVKTSSYPNSATFVIINYDVLKKHHDVLREQQWDMVVYDEAHYCKNPKAQRTKEALGFQPSKGQRGKPVDPIPAKRIVMLTGTPIVNRPIELWPLLQKLDPEELGGNFWRFAKRYTNACHNGYGWDFSGHNRLEELQRKMRERHMVRRLKEDVLKELPPKRRQVITLPANGCARIVKAEQAAAAKREELLAELQAAVELAKAADDPSVYERAVEDLRNQARVAFTEMSAARHETAKAKVPYVVEHLRDSLESGPVVCFAHHKDVVDAIRAEFPNAAVITGDTPLEARQQAVEDFQSGKTDLFIGNIQAAGVGLTLTRSSHVVFAELDWVPGNMTQAEDRCHRIGQDQSVLVQHLVLEDSLDRQMAAALIEKQEVLDQALDRQVDLPIVPTKERPSTVNVRPDEISKASETLTEAQVEAVHTSLQMLSGMCDGARNLDKAGFNKIDTRIGKSLASQYQLTKRQAALGQRIVRKYHRQLPEGLAAVIKG